MNPNDVQIELKPIKKELVAFEQRVINHASLIASLSARLKELEDARKIQISLNTKFLKYFDPSPKIEVTEKKKSFWEKIRG